METGEGRGKKGERGMERGGGIGYRGEWNGEGRGEIMINEKSIFVSLFVAFSLLTFVSIGSAKFCMSTKDTKHSVVQAMSWGC